MRFHSAAFAVVLAASSTEAFHVAPSRVAFSSRPIPTHPSRSFGVAPPLPQQSSTSLSLKVGGGPEQLQTFIESTEHLSKTSKVKNPKLVKLAGAAALPLTYLIGAAITPTRYLAAKAIGGVVAAATAGGVSKLAVEEDVRNACLPAIASRLVELGVDGPNVADGIERLRDDYGVDEADFVPMKIQVYAQYLVGMAKNPITKTAELKELTQLREALRLTNPQVGQGHYEGAFNLYLDIRATTAAWELRDKEHPDRMAIDKFLFLTDRAFVQGGETEEAQVFEFSRIAKWFKMSLRQARERVHDVANPFYERALKSTREKLESGVVSSEMLEKARNTLGIRDEDAREMSIEAFDREVRGQLGLPQLDDIFDYDMKGFRDYDMNRRVATDAEGRDLLRKLLNEKEEEREEKLAKTTLDETNTVKFKDGAFEHLSKLQEVLGLPDEDCDICIRAAVADYWSQTAVVAFRDVTNNVITPAKCWSIIKKRADELLLKESTMKDLVINIIINTMAKPIQKVEGFAKVSNAAATYDGLLDAIEAKETCKAVCQEAGWKDFENFEAILFNPDNPRSACGFIPKLDRQRMYNLFFSRCLKTDETGRRTIEMEDREKLKILRGMLGISDAAGEEQIVNIFGPELNRILTQATEEIMGGSVTPTLMDNMRDQVNHVITEFGLKEDLKQQSALPLYDKSVRELASRTPGGIPSKDDVATLKSLQDFLGIQEKQMYGIHIKYFGEAYKKAIKEALGSTGIIREEFRAPLEDLRGRLGVSDKASKKIFVEAVGERMQPMVEYIANEMERTVMTNDQLAQKRGADYGEDLFKTGKRPDGKLGLGTEGNIMGDILNLVDFYTENDMIQKEVVGTKKIEKTVEENGEQKTVEEEVPVYENTYPITALGKKWMDKNTAELCYRQFLVNSFTAQGPEAARYDAAKATFGGILGLTAEKMESIGSNIGSLVYDNYVTQALSTKDALDQQDMMFLANMQGKLGISAEQGEEMLHAVQKKLLSEEANKLLNGKKKKPPTPEEIKAFREKCNSMGMDLEDDVGLSRARIVNMFSLEISPGIDSGEITMDSGDLIAEVQESLGLTEEEGEEIISNLITERAALLYVSIRSSLLRGFEFEALDDINKLIQYARFVDGDLGLIISDRDAHHAFSVYDNSDKSGIDEETLKERERLLKKTLGLLVEEKESESVEEDESPANDDESEDSDAN